MRSCSHRRRRRTAAVLTTAGIFVATLTTSPAVPGADADQTATRLTQSAAATLMSEIADRTWTSDAKQYGYMIRFDRVKNAVLVISDAPERVLAPLRAAHPGHVLTHPGTITQVANRFIDEAPFYGAGSITNGKHQCTSGMAIVADGQRFMTTAAHCFEVGDRISSYSESPGEIVRSNMTVDTALIHGSFYSRDRIWVGVTPGDRAGMTISGAGSPDDDQSDVCISGQTTLYHCGHTVGATEVEICRPTDPHCVRNVFTILGSPLVQVGDSGAPVFTVNSGEATIIGVVYGFTTDKETGDRVSYGVPIADVLNYFDARLAAIPGSPPPSP